MAWRVLLDANGLIADPRYITPIAGQPKFTNVP